MAKLVIYIGGFLFLMTYLASRGGLANEDFVRSSLTLEQEEARASVSDSVTTRKKSIEREIEALQNELETLTDEGGR